MSGCLSLDELVQTKPLTEIRVGELYFCYEYRTVSVRGQDIDLTPKEFDIFALLIMNRRRVLTYEMITDIVWKDDADFYSRKTITMHIVNLRKKLTVAEDIPDYIKSKHGVGYKFNL